MVKSNTDSVEHTFWPKGAEEFRMHFGPAANFFAGALEYIRLATGWKYPYHSLDVMVFNSKKPTSGGFAIYPPGLTGNPNGSEARIFWADGEFTMTVLHELIHLFKKTKVLPPPDKYEEWVEQQALILTVGI